MARLALILLACSLVVCHGQYLGGDNDKAGGADGEGEEKKEITDKYEVREPSTRLPTAIMCLTRVVLRAARFLAYRVTLIPKRSAKRE